ncbi:hypothetical protein PO909_001877 [Leuciscus waleckii]
MVVAGREKEMVMAGRRDPDGKGGGSLMTQTQSFPVPKAHGGDKGGRSKDVAGLAVVIWGTTNGDRTDGPDGADQWLMKLNDIAGAGDQGDVAATSVA